MSIVLSLLLQNFAASQMVGYTGRLRSEVISRDGVLASPIAFKEAPPCTVPDSAQKALSQMLGASKPFVFCLPYNHVIRRVEPFQSTWLSQAGRPAFSGSCHPGQFLTFQIGVLARQDIRSIRLRFPTLKGKRDSISKDGSRCISLGGTDMNGKPFHKSLPVAAGHLQPLWCGIDVPKSAHGEYKGVAELTLSPGGTIQIPLKIWVSGPALSDWGADDPNALTRLRWLDSTAGQGTSITKPFVPVQVKGREIRVLGREMKIGENGLPTQIISHFSPANTQIVKESKDVLAAPMKLSALDYDKKVSLDAGISSIKSSTQQATWRSKGRISGFEFNLTGRLDYTGSGQISMQLTALRDMPRENVTFEIPYTREASKYMMGLNRKGGQRPSTVDWKWDTARHQDCFWMGDVNAGLMVRLKGANYHRPLLNIYYSFLPLAMPDSWGNDGRGGVHIGEIGDQVNATAYSGQRSVMKGDVLRFDFELYLTPFRTIDTEKQWSTRFIHPHPSREPKPLDDALAQANPVAGPNVINVHQATYYNPYINYPYSPDSFADFTNFVKRAHDKGVRARVYYTTREITQNMPELYALHSLNGEVVFPGPGKDAKTLINPNGPAPWLVQNLGSDFVPAWVDHVGGKYANDDISVITTPDSRWNNFYLEGLKWMVDRAKIDGVYIDDTALDASSLRRARRILSARPNPIIDLHTWNHFNQYAGYANNLNMYMEVLPYLDRLWLGEGFDCNQASWDYWLVEMSGLPFGLMSEMLDSPNPIRGLVFGETGRLGWSGDPRSMWKLFDQYGMKGSEMMPFFSPNCPVQFDLPTIKATVYRGKTQSIVAIGNWTDRDMHVKVNIHWKALHLDPSKAIIEAPSISGVQTASIIPINGELDIPKSGLVLVFR